MHRRRTIAIGLVVLGGILMFLAPEVWAGLILLVLGVLVEAIGITLEKKKD
jgi:drug/metabolite transporter (DMT)-like permease